MEESLNVSIGGISFTIGAAAYQKLSAYISDLEVHYAGKKEGREIIDDIEHRIAELLLERNGDRESVSLSDVEDVLSIMGNPSQFEEEEDVSSQATTSTPDYEAPRPQHRLYRDRSDRMIGGVCSGLAHYFRIDVSILRFILGLMVAVRIFAPDWLWSGYRHFFMLVVLLYIVLMIVVPEAKTYSQKCQMVGDDPGVKGAEEKARRQKSSSSGWFSRILKFFGGVLFLTLGIVYASSVWSLFIGSNILMGTNPFSFLSLVEMNPVLRLLVKLSVLLSILIPCLVFFYIGIRWLFNLKKPKFRIELPLFLLWLLSLAFLIGFTGSVMGRTDFNSIASREYSRAEMNRNYDTIYVEYTPLPETVNGKTASWSDMSRHFADVLGAKASYKISVNGVDFSSTATDTLKKDGEYHGNMLLYLSKKAKSYAFYPMLDITRKSSSVIVDDASGFARVEKDSAARADIRMSCGKISPIAAISGRKTNSENHPALYEIRDSVLVLHPVLVSKKDKYSGNLYRASICVPDSSVVIINIPGQ